MNVIVRTAGFYAGTWFDAGDKPVQMPDKVAKAFLPPFGDQLAVHVEKKAAPATNVGAEKKSV